MIQALLFLFSIDSFSLLLLCLFDYNFYILYLSFLVSFLFSSFPFPPSFPPLQGGGPSIPLQHVHAYFFKSFSEKLYVHATCGAYLLYVCSLFCAYVCIVSPCAQASLIDARVLVACVAARRTRTEQLMEEKLAAYRSPE